MNLSRRRSIGLALSGIAGAQLARAAAAEADDQGDGATSISWEGLGTKTKILGRLGRPLGDLLRVEGTTVHSNYIRDKGEQAEFLLRVTSVEGREIEEPTVLRLRFFPFLGIDEDIPASTKLSLVGYEDGNLIGVPSAAMEHIREVAGMVPATQGWHFSTHFRVLENLGAPRKRRRTARLQQQR